MNSIITILLGVVTVQSWLFTVYLFRNSNRNEKSNLLIGITTVIGFHFLNLILGRSVEHYSGYWLSWILLSLYGPLLYLYVKSFLGIKNSRRSYFHLMIGLYPVLLELFTEKLHRESSTDVFFDFWVSVPIYGTLMIYLLFGLVRLYNHKGKIKHIAWLKFLLFSFSGVLILHMVTLSIYSSGSLLIGQLFYAFEIGYMIFFTSGMVYTALSRPLTFIPVENIRRYIQSPDKYDYTGMSHSESKELLEELITFVETEKPHFDSELTLDLFAEKMGINKRYISQAINEQLNQNFKEFINSYRIREAIKILSNVDRDLRIFEVMYQVGFNSKNSFNLAFKKETGSTPSEFRDKAITNMSVQST